MTHAVEACVHCGFCLAACPTYRELGQEMDTPRGRIVLMKQVLEGSLSWQAAQPHIDRCLGCLACETACPAGVNYAEMIEFARAEVESNGAKSGVKRNLIRAVGLRWLFGKPGRLRFIAKLLRFDQDAGFSGTISAFLPKPLR